ncbi:hypothetical protein [Engelhardtia mirabilis]|uniref:hypothetical protein n=1 Tax=Engelhardtia mirabilis TaxID=2528011 RepID=UPI0011A9F9D1
MGLLVDLQHREWKGLELRTHQFAASYTDGSFAAGTEARSIQAQIASDPARAKPGGQRPPSVTLDATALLLAPENSRHRLRPMLVADGVSAANPELRFELRPGEPDVEELQHYGYWLLLAEVCVGFDDRAPSECPLVVIPPPYSDGSWTQKDSSLQEAVEQVLAAPHGSQAPILLLSPETCARGSALPAVDPRTTWIVVDGLDAASLEVLASSWLGVEVAGERDVTELGQRVGAEMTSRWIDRTFEALAPSPDDRRLQDAVDGIKEILKNIDGATGSFRVAENSTIETAQEALHGDFTIPTIGVPMNRATARTGLAIAILLLTFRAIQHLQAARDRLLKWVKSSERESSPATDGDDDLSCEPADAPWLQDSSAPIFAGFLFLTPGVFAFLLLGNARYAGLENDGDRLALSCVLFILLGSMAMSGFQSCRAALRSGSGVGTMPAEDGG